MRIEYFQLIDRIIDIDLTDLTIRAEANVPAASTIFEGHFPGHPLMPGVLLIESMAQTSGWLIIARTKFEKMPFLVAVKEAKLRTFVTPGRALTVRSKLIHEGSGFMVTEAAVTADDKAICNATITFRLMNFSTPAFRANMEKFAATLDFPMETAAHG